ncbi:MAG: DUF433 domain-containing protein [Acidimicrobiia bacterium]|nr:DUF433 domain-containing protein [Acidimicrobiia bacterium]MYJ14662.1 DUF433 domain-containing protein [Acidimicrobiia bacterium]
MTNTERLRFDVPLYTVAEAARIVDAPYSTVASWAKGYVRRPPGRRPILGAPIVTAMKADCPGEPTIPFVGLVEALVLAAVRHSGVPMQRIRPALNALKSEIGVEHALASEKLYTDGAEVLYDYGASRRGTDAGDRALALVVVRSNQRVFVEIIQSYLRRITYGDDGYASVVSVPAYANAQVVADPSRSFGAPIFTHGGARVGDVLDRFWSGETLIEAAAEFGVPVSELEDVVRVTSRRAA